MTLTDDLLATIDNALTHSTKPMAVDIGYKGGMAALNAAGNVLPAGASGALDVIGVFAARYDNSGGAAGDIDALIEHGVVHVAAGTGSDAVTEADLPAIVYAIDDESVSLLNTGDRGIAGVGISLDDDGKVRVLMNPWVAIALRGGASPAAVASAALDTPQHFAVEAVAVSNVADLNAFAVSHDGLTLVEGDTVLLTAQSNGAENGIYVLGTVTAGSAPLTRIAAADTGTEIVPGSSCFVRSGTVGADRAYVLTGTGLITIDTTAQVWARRFTGDSGTATLVAGTVTVSTPEVKANSTILVTPAGVSGSTDFSYLDVDTITPGTSFTIEAKTIAHAADGDAVGDVRWAVLN